MSAAQPLPKKRRSKGGNSLAANCSGLSFACTRLILANSLYESLIERISNRGVWAVSLDFLKREFGNCRAESEQKVGRGCPQRAATVQECAIVAFAAGCDGASLQVR